MKVITVYFATDKGIESGCCLETAKRLAGTKDFLPYCEQFEGIPCGPFNTYHLNIKEKFRADLEHYWGQKDRYFFFVERDVPSYDANDLSLRDRI